LAPPAGEPEGGGVGPPEKLADTMKTALQKTIDAIAQNARKAALELADTSPRRINACIRTLASMLGADRTALKKANQKDRDFALGKGLSAAMVERLALTDKTLASMIKGLIEVASLPCPIGAAYDERVRPNGLKIYKVKTPIGVIGIIYESRPNVTIDAAALCIKAHNAVILRGGSEAFNTNTALVRLFSKALTDASLPKNSIQIVPTTDRVAIDFLLKKNDEVDLIIPRGGESLIKTVVEKSHIPVIKHYKGVCHVYVSRHADMAKAIPIAVNAKVQRPSVCNAMETLLLDERLGRLKIMSIMDALQSKGVVVFGDPAVKKLFPDVRRATNDDWYAEYLDLRLAVRIVSGIDAAIDHINTYGSHHTDAIVTESRSEAALFLKRVDSSSLMVNASTRFSDGGEYGLGCEIGISTDKLHARGPMGVEELTSYKWIVEGNGQVRN
jgi:glutamate-5-semialdehyde dehydrogenase